MSTNVNQLIDLFGQSVKHFFRDQQRSAMTSPMFNLPGRLVLGSHCYYENLPQLLGEIRSRAKEQDIGRGMKNLCMRPNYVHLNSLALGYLVGREQARLSGTDTKDDFDRTHSVMEFWSQVTRSCRNDGLLLPDEADFTVPILPAETVSELNGRLRGDLPDTLRRQIHRLVATLELYTFILHGEARVGVSHHGPYPVNGVDGDGGNGDVGDTLVVKELIGLREDFYPWAQMEARLPYDNIACVMRFHDVRSKIVLFGTLTTQPRDYAQSVAAEALFVVKDGVYHPLPDDEIPNLTQTAADAQLELYRRVIDWDDKYRIEYGADLYGYLLKSFADSLGFGEAFGHTIRACFGESIERHLDDLYSGRERAWVLEHIATTNGPIFSPLRGVSA
jgi:hypothetical protein